MTDDGTRWVFDPGDSFAHVLADSAAAQPGVLVTMCRRELPAERTPTFSVPPSLAVCPVCGPSGRVARPAAVFPTPDDSSIPGRSPVSEHPNRSQAPGDRPVSKTASQYALEFRVESERECLTRWAARLRMFAHNSMKSPDDMRTALEMAAEMERLREQLYN